MENLQNMKMIKISVIYFMIVIFLYHIYDSKTLWSILLDYPRIDFRYFLFMSIQFYWSFILYHIIYQYISLYQFMRIRISQLQCYWIILMKNLFYCFFYLGIHVCINLMLSLSINYTLLINNLLIQMISFWIVIILKRGWEYSYIFMNILILLLHFIV